MRQARDYLRFFDDALFARRQAGAAIRRERAQGVAAARPEHPGGCARRWRLLSRMLAVAETRIPSEQLFDLFLDLRARRVVS